MTVITRSPEAVEMTIDNSTIVVDAAGNKMITLNKVAGLIWSTLESPSDLDGLVSVCASRFPNIDQARIRSDVEAFLAEAKELGILNYDT